MAQPKPMSADPNNPGERIDNNFKVLFIPDTQLPGVWGIGKWLSTVAPQLAVSQPQAAGAGRWLTLAAALEASLFAAGLGGRCCALWGQHHSIIGVAPTPESGI